MDIKEYLNLGDIDWGNEFEIVAVMTSPKLAQWVETETLERLCFYSDNTFSNSKSLEHNFRTRQGCVRNLCSTSGFMDYVYDLIAQRAEIQGKLGAMVKSLGLGAVVRSINAEWSPWNEYDPLCNPELLKPYWRIKIIASYA